MLQRVQTIYILTILALTGSVFFMPLAVLHIQEHFYEFGLSGIVDLSTDEVLIQNRPAFILAGICMILVFISLFLFKKRVLQMRILGLSALLQLGFVGVTAYFISSVAADMGGEFSLNLSILLPLIAFIFSYLAIRAIGKDEALVRSLDRIR